MDFSWRDILKYVKLVIVHPATEIIIEIFYFITALFIATLLFKESSQYDEHQLLDLTGSYLNINTFNNIKTSNDLKSYLISTLDKLYTLNPSNEEIPLFIPLNPIRINYYEKENECNDKIDYSKSCKDSMNKFKCVIENLVHYFKYKCGESYQDGDDFFDKKLKGYYSYYELKKENKHYDITRKTYYSKYENTINELLENKSLKAIVLQINLKAPANDNYVDAYLAIEMTNYFTNVKTVFSVCFINEARPSTNTLLYVSLIFLIISVFLSTLKLIYEMNVKCIYSIHLVALIVKLFDICFIINCIAYLAEDKKLKFDINLDKFESHVKYIHLIWFLKIFFGVLVLFLPFRLIALFSWWKKLSEPIIVIMNILFRMSPGLIVSFFFILFLYLIFCIINYFLFNDIFPYYESIYQSFISSFNINIISALYNPKNSSKIFHNLFLSKYSIIFIYFEIIAFFFMASIFVATLVYMFKKAILFQEPEEDNNYMEKLNEIKNKLEDNKNEEEINNDLNSLNKKQILWLCLDKEENKLKHNIDNENYVVLYFKNSGQIISFIKYLFSLKPNLQHMKLLYKLNIIIETNQIQLELNDKKEINKLTDWLIFKECKIPLIFYGLTKFDSSYKNKLRTLYKQTLFINNKNELEKLLKNEGKKIMTISSNEQFTLGN